jgi:nucleotide-binding universal stress UspA family protein
MKILLAIDGSRHSLAAVRFVCAYLAYPARRVDVLHVLPLVVQPDAAFPRHQPEHVRIPPSVRSWFDRTARRLQARAFSVKKHVRRGLPAQVVPALAARGRYDLVVIGAKGRSNNPFLAMGSVALAVLEQHVSAHVLLVREPELKREKQIPTGLQPFTAIFATDGSPRLEQAARGFHEMFTVPHLQPVALAVADAPGPAVLARSIGPPGIGHEQRSRCLRIRASGRRRACCADGLLRRSSKKPGAATPA